uniref:Four-jointed box kinase 1 n=1 Tax=Callorhinchus milii TaxID=7868 RepID=A0A4W3HUH4_CALMI|eukprot:gi/632973194/ref/XP_007903033.1/ PREDICTED: four-jointed box protein 1 [Callorhinchus milii]
MRGRLGRLAALGVLSLLGLWGLCLDPRPLTLPSPRPRNHPPRPPANARTFRTLLSFPGERSPRSAHSDSTSPSGAGDGQRPFPGPGVTEHGVFWSDGLSGSIPSGYSEAEVKQWLHAARTSRLVALETGCGRTPNRLARFEDGTRACLRYGINPDQILGETLSFYLSRLLGIRNVPAMALSLVDTNAEQWARVRQEVEGSQWAERTIVSLTQWVNNLSEVVPPNALRVGKRRLHPLKEDLDNATREELRDLVQWSDLILFDYLTANFDRLASNVLSLQWDPRALERPTHNLHRTPQGVLLFIDNEAGLVHGYRVLPMWDRHHELLLKSLCVFRRETARRVAELHKRQNMAVQLLELYRASEPLAPHMGFLSEDQARVLQSRADHVYRHILQCKARYSP